MSVFQTFLDWAEQKVDWSIITIGELVKTWFQEVWRLVFRIATFFLTLLLGFLHKPSFEKYVAEQRGRIHTHARHLEHDRHLSMGRKRSRSAGEAKSLLKKNSTSSSSLQSKVASIWSNSSVSPDTPHYLSSSHINHDEESPLDRKKISSIFGRSNSTDLNTEHLKPQSFGGIDNQLRHFSVEHPQSTSLGSNMPQKFKNGRRLRSRLRGFAGLLDDENFSEDNSHTGILLSDRTHPRTEKGTLSSDFDDHSDDDRDVLNRNSESSEDEEYDEYYGSGKPPRKLHDSFELRRQKTDASERLFSLDEIDCPNPLLECSTKDQEHSRLPYKEEKTNQNENTQNAASSVTAPYSPSNSDHIQPVDENIFKSNETWGGYLLSTLKAVAEEVHTLAQSQISETNQKENSETNQKEVLIPAKTNSSRSHNRSKSLGLETPAISPSGNNFSIHETNILENQVQKRTSSKAIDIPSSYNGESEAPSSQHPIRGTKRVRPDLIQSMSASSDSHSHLTNRRSKRHRYTTIEVNKDRIFTSEKLSTGVLEDIRMWFFLQIDDITNQCRKLSKWFFNKIRHMMDGIVLIIHRFFAVFTSLTQLKMFLIGILSPWNMISYVLGPLKWIISLIWMTWGFGWLIINTFDPLRLKCDEDDRMLNENVERVHGISSKSSDAAIKLPQGTKSFDTRNVQAIVTSQGYPYESYQVITEDGYILKLERLSRKESKRVLYFQHGVVDNSFAWFGHVEGDSGSAIAFRMYDAGYDVFVGTLRGCSGSTNHVRKISSRDYWNFSVELGL